MEPEVLRGPLLENKTVVINQHLDSFGQCLSTKSDDYLIQTIHALPNLIRDQKEFADSMANTLFAQVKKMKELNEKFRKLPRTSPDRKKMWDMIINLELITKQDGVQQKELTRRLKTLGNLQGDLQLYIYEAHKRGISSVSDMKQALETAGLYADVAQLPLFSFLSTSTAPAPSAPTHSQEVIEISSDDEEPFDFASADDVARQFMEHNTD